MVRKLNLMLCTSAHLPSGASEAEFEALYNSRIKPIISALDKFPKINMMFFYSGVMFYWIERRHPECFMLLKDLLSRKQIEFLGGGFYNPALPLLPMADKIGQIEMFSTYLRKHFGRRPHGCWLPAMAWEQNLVGPLASCGMSFVFLDDFLFAGAGLKPIGEKLFFPCITEAQGKLIKVFPVASAIARNLPGKPLKKVIKELEDAMAQTEFTPRDTETPVLILPVGTEVSVVSDYEFFFDELMKIEETAKSEFVIEFVSPNRLSKNLQSLKKVYFSNICSSEIKSANESCPRQFIANYPEAGGIYSKMIYVHSLINNRLRGDKVRKRAALEELWKAQDSGIYRLGSKSSPGLSHSRIRKAAYRSLLEAEKITRERKKLSPSLSVFDFDLDGEGEYVFSDDKLNCSLKSRGASIFELDYLPASWNYLDTLDGKRRCAFADWLAPARTLLSDLGPAGIKGGFFCGAEEYEVSETDRVRRRLKFRLPARKDLSWGEIETEKTLLFKKNYFVLEYVLTNTGAKEAGFVFSSSVDLSFPGEGKDSLRVMFVRETEKEALNFDGNTAFQNIRLLEFQDIKNEALISLESNRYFDGKVFSVISGLADNAEYQSTCLMPLFPVSLEAGKSWKVVFTFRINS